MVGLDTRGIDEILLEMGVLKITDLKRAWDIQRESKGNIEEILVELGLVSSKDIMIANATKMGIEFIDLAAEGVKDTTIQNLITKNIAHRYKVLPIEKDNNVLTVAMKDPTDIFSIDDIRLATGLEIKPVLADSKELEKYIVQFYGEDIRIKDVKPDPEKDGTVIEAKIQESLKEKENMLLDNSTYNSIKQDVELPDLGLDNFTNTPVDNFSDKTYSENGLFKDKIGNLLVKAGVITQDQLERALAIQKKNGGLIGQTLVKEGYINSKSLYEFLEKQMGVQFVDLDTVEFSEEALNLVSYNLARMHKVIPLSKSDSTLKVAMSDPMNIFSIDDLRLTTGLEIVPCLAEEELIAKYLDIHYNKANRSSVSGEKKLAKLDEEIQKVKEKIAVEIMETQQEEEIVDVSNLEDAPIVKMVNIIFQKAIASRASDIHIEPQQDCVLVRYRIDGQLVEITREDIKIMPSLAARIKIISGLNIAEKRVPQDGRISLNVDGKNYDLRVSVLPTMFGEKIVMRITDKDGFNVTKEQLGFFEDDLVKFNNIISHPHGIILVTGPTGSGKSTTLYTALRELCKPNVNILTVEDPVENTIRGINQVQVNAKAGMTFAAALRAFLRQDPDIIMVGEIRDGETAEIATRSAITGHLVFSTLHTNDAPSSITRMIDMGIEPFLISSSVVGVLAQRLVRRLCPKCKEEAEVDDYAREILGLAEDEKVTIYKAKGCNECNNIGYKGRIAVYEIMEIDREIRQLIAKNANSDTIKEVAISKGMKTLRMNCARLVKNGTTTIDEMLKIAFSKD